jgi:predicted metal-dependent phosphoesterase TrpH
MSYSAPLKFDFHLHTLDDPYDRQVFHTVSELIDKAAGLGFGALSVTLHGAQFESETARQYARDKGVLLIPGVEQDVEGKHVLLINFPKPAAEAVRTFADLARAKAAHPEALVVAAHPFYPAGTCLKEKLLEHRACFDAVEISGYYRRGWDPNEQAREAAARLGLPLVGNSDTHTLEQFGTTWSEVDCPHETAALIAAIKAGRAAVRGRPLGLAEMALITWKVVARGYMPWVDYRKQRGYPR